MQGPQGTQGPQGNIGPQGPQGIPGTSASLGGNNNYFLYKTSTTTAETNAVMYTDGTYLNVSQPSFVVGSYRIYVQTSAPVGASVGSIWINTTP